MKAARAAIAAVPGAEEVLGRDWVRAARFYARFGITETQFQRGIPSLERLLEHDGAPNLTMALVGTRAEALARADATLPVDQYHRA